VGVRWPSSSRVYLAVSLGLAVAAGLVVRSTLAGARAAGEGGQGPMVDVVVAATRLSRGVPLSTEGLTLAAVPEAYAPPGAFQRIEQAAGRVALSDLATGEVVTQTRLARVRAGPVASLVPEGLRAFAVPSTLPPGSVAAGDRVDVLATYGSGQPYTETVVEGVEVLLVLGPPPPTGSDDGLSVDTAAAGIGTPTVLVLLVAPEQQEDLAFARAFADLAVTVEPAEASP